MSPETSTLSGWVGATTAALKPLVDALAADLLAGDNLHVDDIPVPVLAPGTGNTKAERLWTCDERPFAGSRPPAALFFYSPDRKGEHPQTHLKDFRGVIHADGGACPRAGRRPDPGAGSMSCSSAGRLSRPAVGRMCGANSSMSTPPPAHPSPKQRSIASASSTPSRRPSTDPARRRRQRRQLQSKPIAEALAAWAEHTVRQLSRKSELAAAFRYMRARWTAGALLR